MRVGFGGLGGGEGGGRGKGEWIVNGGWLMEAGDVKRQNHFRVGEGIGICVVGRGKKWWRVEAEEGKAWCGGRTEQREESMVKFWNWLLGATAARVRAFAFEYCTCCDSVFLCEKQARQARGRKRKRRAVAKLPWTWCGWRGRVRGARTFLRRAVDRGAIDNWNLSFHCGFRRERGGEVEGRDGMHRQERV